MGFELLNTSKNILTHSGIGQDSILRSRTQSANISIQHSEKPCEGKEEMLDHESSKRLYDTATWRMYYRIMNSRRNNSLRIDQRTSLENNHICIQSERINQLQLPVPVKVPYKQGIFHNDEDPSKIYRPINVSVYNEDSSSEIDLDVDTNEGVFTLEI